MKNDVALESRIRILTDVAFFKTEPEQRSTASRLLKGAIALVQLLPDASKKANYFNDVVWACVRLNLQEMGLAVLEEALEAARLISEASSKSEELSRVGHHYAKLKQTEKGLPLIHEAFQIAQTIEDVDSKDFALCEVAYAYGVAGETNFAFEVVALIFDPYRAATRVFASLGRHYIHEGEHDRALQCIEASKYTGNEGIVIGEMVGTYVFLNDFNRAVQLAEKQRPVNRSFEYLRFAQAKIEKNCKDEAMAFLNQAAAIVETIEERGYKSRLRGEIADVRKQLKYQPGKESDLSN